MPAIFVHVSDIHFGQERDDSVHIHDDVKRQVIADAASVIRKLPGGNAHGVLVTGDIAQGGKREQYEDAGHWLDELAKAIGCEIFRIQMVPGNHDLDRDKSSISTRNVLGEILKGGKDAFEEVLKNDTDREALFTRFEAYGRFCEGYDCPLDAHGRYASNMKVELAPGRTIRFVRMNSALLCTGKERDTDPQLLIGARQFVIPREPGEEIVVLIHHPLNWFVDHEDVRTYLRSRARVLISGHEHNPSVGVDPVEADCDMMTLAAGATVPYKSTVEFTYSYNVLEFDWNSQRDALAVTIHPRRWNPTMTRFEPDNAPLQGRDPCVILGSPNFRQGQTVAKVHQRPVNTAAHIWPVTEPVIEMVAAAESEKGADVPPDVAGYQLVLLKFFRDLTEGERLRILVDLDAVDTDSNERMTQATERALFDWLVRNGKINELSRHIDDLIADKKTRGD